MSTVDQAERDETITEEEIDAAVERLLADCEVTLDELRSSAASGTFETEKHRRAWFVIRGLGRG